MPAIRTNLNIVLHQTRSPDNLGAVARLMANFGFERLILSDPVTYAFEAAEKLAIKGEKVLERLQVTTSLKDAISDSVWVCGTTSRAEVHGRQVRHPGVALEKLVEEARRGRVALLFGGEKRGLSDDELSNCSDILRIPTAAAQPSMNLAQSAAILLYLCARAIERDPEATAGPREEGARLMTLQTLEERMKESLLAAGYLNPQAPEYAVKELLRTLMRSQLTQREAEMWLSAFHHLQMKLTR